MLDQQSKDQVRSAFASLSSQFTLQITVSANHPSHDEIVNLLSDVADCSDKITCHVVNGQGLSFSILKDGQHSGISFRAVPTGHEFTTLLLAILNLDGIGKNLPDELIKARIQKLRGKVKLKSYVSLTCTNCPQVVQALNVITILNPSIEHEIIDGAINQDEVDELGVQAVPTVYANEEVLHVGRSSLGELLDKLEKAIGSDFTPNVSTEEKEYDVVVVGGGPAGVSAAIYSARKGFSVAIIAAKIGGQVVETVSIENMISVPKTTGSELTANLARHLKEYPIDLFENRLIENASIKDGIKKLNTNLGETFSTPALIITTGASWRKLGIPGESEYLGAGVAFCAHCDGPFYKQKKVVVVGGGNSGLEAAIDLAAIASDVTVLEFADGIKGDKVLHDKIKTLNNVKVLTNAESQSINGDGKKVTTLQYRDRESGSLHSLDTDGVFVQIGLTPNSSVFADIVDTNQAGEIKIDANCRTSQAGVYAAGDVTVVPFKQIVIAMGEGSKAALSAFEDNIKNRQLSN